MVSRRNFFSIFIMMAVLLFMFQFSQVYKESGNDYDTNEYVAKAAVSGADRWQDAGLTLSDPALTEKEYVIFFGREGSDLEDIVSQWCTYTKRNLMILSDTKEYDRMGDSAPEMVLIDSSALDFSKETEKLIQMAGQGSTIVFCNLPDAEVIKKQDSLRELLGIRSVQETQTQIQGVHLFSDFLLGGEALYLAMDEEEAKERQDMELAVPWYITGKGTKTYMTGLMEEEEIDREEYPALIWRNKFDDAFVFAVNGDYMSGLTGLGILDAIAYEASDYEIYPIVNAQNVMMVDYPGFSSENGERMMALYSRDARAVYRDVMWPSVAAMAKRNNLKLTCYISPQFDYSDGNEPTPEDAVFYLQQLNEIDGEAGRSLICGEEVTLAEKNARDNAFYAGAVEDYQFGAAYAGQTVSPEMKEELTGSLQGIRTLGCGYGAKYPLLSYYTDEVTLQCATGESREFTYSMDLQFRSLMTALGYSNVVIDMHPVIWPEGKEDQWENYFDEVSSNISTYWNRFPAFSRTTLTESDRRVRALLNLDYTHQRVQDTIYLKVSGMDEEAWFLLRTHGEQVTDAQGAEVARVEKDAYLIYVSLGQAEIHMQKSDEILEYPY
ncbi:MAG: DUF2194 domain-containing protein [Lachnospiraceae bacterium]|nr:DUF2194 domain-containing protein [Lachnospiraceae bacterium]